MLNSCQYFTSKERAAWRAFETPLLYYPGGFDDIEPLDMILGGESLSDSYEPYHSSRDSRSRRGALFPAFAQAIYADYSINDESLDRFIESIKSRYGMYEHSEVIQQRLSPEDFNKNLDDFFPSPSSRWPFYQTQTDGNWSEFNRFDPRDQRDYFFGRRIYFNSIGFNLIYLRTEAIQTYRILQSMKVNPNIVVFHDLFGGAWTDFGGESLLYKAAKVKPRYLYSGDNVDPWPNYQRVAESRLNSDGRQSIHRSLYKRK